jgi:hypothetical protein
MMPLEDLQYFDKSGGQGGLNFPLAQSPSSSEYGAPQPPPGVNPYAYGQTYSAKMAENQALEAEKAKGSAEFLALAPSSIDTYRKYKDVFGPTKGREWYQMARSAYASATGDKEAARNAMGYDEVNRATKILSLTGLKAAFGARPAVYEVQQNQQLYGGLTSASAESAESGVLREMAKHAQTLQDAVVHKRIVPNELMSDPNQRAGVYYGIQRGLLDPKYFLPTAASPHEAHQLGSGTMFLTPQGKVMRVP